LYGKIIFHKRVQPLDTRASKHGKDHHLLREPDQTSGEAKEIQCLKVFVKEVLEIAGSLLLLQLLLKNQKE
jgi:hypothetical protein